MKIYNKSFIFTLLFIIVTAGLASCDDFLDKEPMSNAAPENTLTDVTQLAYMQIIYMPTFYHRTVTGVMVSLEMIITPTIRRECRLTTDIPLIVGKCRIMRMTTGSLK